MILGFLLSISQTMLPLVICPVPSRIKSTALSQNLFGGVGILTGCSPGLACFGDIEKVAGPAVASASSFLRH